MDREGHTALVEMKGLLSRQLASIADALASTSLRRNENVPIRKNYAVKDTFAGKLSTSYLTISSEPAPLCASNRNGSRVKLDQQRNGFDDHDVDDQQASMATSSVSMRGGHELHAEEDLLNIMVTLNRTQHPSKTGADSPAHIQNAKQTLANLERKITFSAPTRIDNEQGESFANSKRQIIPSTQSLYQEYLHNLITVPNTVTATPSSERDSVSYNSTFSNARASTFEAPSFDVRPDFHSIISPDTATVTDKKFIEYTVALELERARCEWEIAKGWTTYLFNSGLGGHKAQQDKIAFVMRETKKLESIIYQHMEEDLETRKIEEHERLPCRLILSNLAADAGEEDVRLLLHRSKFDVRDITFLNIRHPTRRTRIACVDMWTRKAALQASYMVDYIFGLVVDISLAVEGEGH